MTTELRALLDELYQTAVEHDGLEPDHGRKLLSLEPATAQLLSLMVRVRAGGVCSRSARRVATAPSGWRGACSARVGVW